MNNQPTPQQPPAPQPQPQPVPPQPAASPQQPYQYQQPYPGAYPQYENPGEMMGVIGCVLNLLGICIGGIILGIISRSKSKEVGMSTTWGTVSLVWGIIGTVLGFIIGLIVLIVILTNPYLDYYHPY